MVIFNDEIKNSFINEIFKIVDEEVGRDKFMFVIFDSDYLYWVFGVLWYFFNLGVYEDKLKKKVKLVVLFLV